MQRVEIQNVLQPGKIYRVEASRYNAARAALLAVLPEGQPGMTPKDAVAAARELLPADLFPGGDKAGWWIKAAQLDLEAKGLITRGPGAPVRLWLAPQAAAK